MDLVPLRIKITIGTDGRHKYPPFNDLSSDLRDGMDWSQYIDKNGGWQYDHFSGFGESDTYNPDPNCWYGCILVSEAFADEALTKWPDLVEEMNEVQFEDFHDKRAHAHEQSEKYDVEILQALAAKKTLGLPLSDEDNRALDPNDPMPGIRKNNKKTWKDKKALMKVKIPSRPNA